MESHDFGQTQSDALAVWAKHHDFDQAQLDTLQSRRRIRRYKKALIHKMKAFNLKGTLKVTSYLTNTSKIIFS
ncbi:hypothetical protein CXF86_14165 [Shewanella sp. GutCb]|nr:hypothetical protein CXF86_14165 [Shewanella sp. GutCb]